MVENIRKEQLIEHLAEQQVDALIVTNPVNLRWLTGYTGTNGLALIIRDGTAYFFTDFRYEQQILTEVRGDWEYRVGTGLDLLAGACDFLLQCQFRGVLAVEESYLSASSFLFLQEMLASAPIELSGIDDIFTTFRRQKDQTELAAIRTATQIADQAFSQVILGQTIIGQTEREVALELEFAMRRLGADSAAFPIIIASGEQGALPHGQPRDVEIPTDTLVIVDWGAKRDGYCSDCTRTVATGEVSAQMQAVYETVLCAQQKAVSAVSVGSLCHELDQEARSIIAAAGYGKYFQHSLGHGVGLDIHEAPRIGQKNSEVLAANEVVTIEPGVYIPNEFGVRIEDLVVVGESQSEVLTTISKRLTVVH